MPRVEFAYFVMTSRAVSNYLYSIETIVNIWVLRDKKLFACLTCKNRVIADNDSVSDDSAFLSNNLSYLSIKLKRQKFPMPPLCKPTAFSVVICTCINHLRSNQDDPLVEAEHPAIVKSVFVI